MFRNLLKLTLLVIVIFPLTDANAQYYVRSAGFETGRIFRVYL